MNKAKSHHINTVYGIQNIASAEIRKQHSVAYLQCMLYENFKALVITERKVPQELFIRTKDARKS